MTSPRKSRQLSDAASDGAKPRAASPKRSRAPRRPPKSASKHSFRRQLTIATAIALAVPLLAWWSLRWIPLPKALTSPPPPSVEYLDRHNQPLRWTPDESNHIRRPLAESDAPHWIVRTTLAAEDARFFSHPGVDTRSTLRAALQWIRNRRIVSGGSTITQQLVKMAHPRPRTLQTKLIEAAQALRLEQVWDKQQILTAYLASLPYGNQCVGLDAASHHYFGKPPAQLTLAESALLAGLPQSPSRLNPRRNLERANNRKEWILGRCLTLGWITLDEWDRAMEQTIDFAPPERPFSAPHFMDLLQLLDPSPPSNTPQITTVKTTLDLELHRTCQSILRTHLTRLKPHHVQQGAIVIVDNSSSAVLALVGSDDWHNPRDGQINGAWIPRSPGSALKPFTWLIAFSNGATAADIIPDVPGEFPSANGTFSPVNYDRICHGPVRLRTALASSLNIPAVRLLEMHGGTHVLANTLRDCGISTLSQSPSHYGLGLTLGNADVRLLELVNAYATIARLGLWRPLQWRVNPSSHSPASTQSLSIDTTHKRVFSANACWLVADILQDADARVPGFGRDSSLEFPFPVACKTGTSSSHRDNWAIGFTPEFTVGVWTGNFDASPMLQVSGVTGAAPILHDIFTHLHDKHGTSWFTPPEGLQHHIVHPITGHAIHRPLKPGEAAHHEVFLAGSEPVEESSADYGPDGHILLDSDYAEWLRADSTGWTQRVQLRSAHHFSHLRILSPASGLILYLDPDLPSTAQRIRLQASAPCNWFSPSLVVESDGENIFHIQLAVGRHELHAENQATGERVTHWVEVRQL